MAKRKAELDNNNGEQREIPIFIDTSLNTHLILLLSHLDTFSLLKQKLLIEHPKCFPDFGDIKISALQVKRKGCYYHLSDSMLVKTVFYGVAKGWFLFADISSELTCAQTPENVLAIMPARPTENQVAFLKGEHFGTSSYTSENKSHPKISKISALCKVPDECNSFEKIVNQGGSGDKAHKSKKNKRKKKKNNFNGELLDTVDDNPANAHLDIESKREMEHLVLTTNSALLRQGISCNVDLKTLHIERPSGDGDAQSLGLPPATDSRLKGVVSDTKWKNGGDDASLPSSPAAEKIHKVANDIAQEMSLLGTRPTIPDPDRLTFELGTSFNRNVGEAMQNSRLVDLHGFSSKISNTSKTSRKRKIEEKLANDEFAEVNKKENLKDSEHYALNSASIATDEMAEVETIIGSACVPSLSSPMEDGGNKLVKDLQEKAHQLEGTSSSLHGIDVNEKGVGDVEISHGSQKKTKKVKKLDLNGVDKNHPASSSKVHNFLEKGVAPAEGENSVKNGEQNNTITTETEKTVPLNTDPMLTLDERQTGEEIGALKPLAVKCTLKLGDTATKKKTKKHLNSMIERQELCSLENHQDMGNLTSLNGSAEVHNRFAPANEVDNERSASKTVHEIFGLENVTQKKSGKKGKNSDAQKPDLSNNTNSKDVASLIYSDVCAEDHNRHKLCDKATTGECIPQIDENKDSKLKTDTLSSQCDGQEPADMAQIGAESLQLAQIIKLGENVEVKSDKPKKKTQKKKIVPVNDPLEFLVEEQLCEKPRDPRTDGDLLTNCDINGTKLQIGADHPKAKESHVIPLPEISTDLTEVKKLDKHGASKNKATKLDLPSSVDTSASGLNMMAPKKRRGSEKTEDATHPQNADKKTKYARKIGKGDTESLQPPLESKPEEDKRIRRDKPKKMTQRKQTVVKDPDPLGLPIEQQLDDETGMMVPKTDDANLFKKSDINHSNHKKEVSRDENLCEEFNDIPGPKVSSGLAEVGNGKKPHESEGEKKLDVPSSVDTSPNVSKLIKSKKSKGSEKISVNGTERCEVGNWKKPHASKEGEKKVDVPSSVHTSSNGPKLIKSKKSNGNERISVNGTEPCESISKKKHIPPPSSKAPRISKERLESQACHVTSMNSCAKEDILPSQNGNAKKDDILGPGLLDGSKSSGAPSLGSGTCIRRPHHKKKAKELQKKPDDRTFSLNKMGEAVNDSAQGKGLLAASGAIFEDESYASADGEDKMDGSGSSPRTPSDVSSSDYSEGETGGVVTSAHGSSKGGEKNKTDFNMSGSNKQTLESILRGSSRYRKAKLVALQSQVEDGESQPVEFVPDSQANL